ncbi:MAG: tRNA1(Val) (adenine(37)-N6)-methyltransferase [Bacteroidota bacterium]
MSETSFRFKQFTIHQEKCAMKVGTDAVLLGSWVLPENSNHVLDIGSGTGIISLMLAQKSEAEIDAIDIDENAYLQTKENFRISPWFFRLYPHHISLQEFAKDKAPSYDLIVTNPPYFHHASKPNVEARVNARHSEVLTFDELIDGTIRLLLPNGRLCVILPCKEGMEFLDKAQKRGLFCRNLLRVRTRSDKSEKRLLMQFSFQFGTMTDEEITIQEEDGTFTNDYIELTKEYYINLKNSLTNNRSGF